MHSFLIPVVSGILAILPGLRPVIVAAAAISKHAEAPAATYPASAPVSSEIVADAAA